VKSNDQKQPLTMDGSRVQHQAKYLGLAGRHAVTWLYCLFLSFHCVSFAAAACRTLSIVYTVKIENSIHRELFSTTHTTLLTHHAENIKVRRAGFAYRNDFHRFLDRFGILSPTTYPEWRGTDLVRSVHVVWCMC